MNIGGQYFEIIIHRCCTSELAFGADCFASILDSIRSKYGTLGKGDKYISKNTLHTLNKKLDSQSYIQVETLFNLVRTIEHDGFLFRYCVESDGCVCTDTT